MGFPGNHKWTYFVVLGVDEHRIDSYNRFAVFNAVCGKQRLNTIFTFVVADGPNTLARRLPGEFRRGGQEGFE
jgi:hypothetical protein